MKIKLGQVVVDKMTGFRGTVDHLLYQLYAGDRVGIQSQVDKDGKMGECQMVDSVGVEVVGESPIGDVKESKPKYSMGSQAKCSVTGFEGTITAYATYINGCIRYKVQPKIAKGAKASDFEAQYLPEGALIVKENKEEAPKIKTGGPREKHIRGTLC